MLESTFVHVPDLGVATERSLWKQGCLTWRDLLGGIGRYSLGTVDRWECERFVRESVDSLAQGRHQFFQKHLGLKNAWRAYPDFRNSCAYLDIETDGGMGGDSITTIGIFDGKEFRCLIKDDDLGNFPDVISHYSMVVTFFGAGFDVPVLERSFFGLRMDQIHIDLCPTLKRLGIRGGLKRIEKQLGILRAPELDGLSGRDAIRLWRRYQRGDDAALRTLIAYNREDVVNLEKLAEYAYDRLWSQTFPQDLAFDF